MLDWSWAVERLTTAKNYWFCTTRPDGRPHAMPAWAAWVDGALYFDGSPETRRGRNLAANPAIVIHLESGDEVVILEGEAVYARQARARARRAAGGSAGAQVRTDVRARAPTPGTRAASGCCAQRWRSAGREFPTNVTRWRFPKV